MGAPTAQVQSPLQPSGKGGYSSRPSSALANAAENPLPSSDPNFDPNSLMQGGPGIGGGYLQPMGGPNGKPEYGAAVQPQRQMQPQGKGGAITTPVQSGQPSIGRPNTYANTVGPWDNSTNSTQMPFKGKGKGA